MQGEDFHRAARRNAFLQLFYRVFFVCFDSYYGAFCPAGSPGEFHSVKNRFGFCKHQSVVGGEIRLAFGAVDNQHVNLLVGGDVKLYVGRECRSAHADEAVFAGYSANLCGRKRGDRCVIAYAARRRLQVAAMLFFRCFDSYCLDIVTESSSCFPDAFDYPRDGCVDIGGEAGACLGNELKTLHFIARLDNSFCRRAFMLGMCDGYLFRQLQIDDG